MDDSVADQASASVWSRTSTLPDVVNAPWLLSTSTVECWYFRQDVAGYASSHYTVAWKLADEADVSRARREYWVDIAQRAVLAYGSGEAANNRVTSIVGFARSVRSFVQWACCTRCCESLSALSKDDVRAYENYVFGLGVTKSSAEQRLSALRALGACLDADGRKMLFQPYRWRGDLQKAVKRVGRANGRTRTLEPEAFFRLLDYSLSRIEDSEGVVSRAVAYQLAKISSRRPSRSCVLGEYSATQVINDARLTYGACIVMAFSLLSSRKHQLALLDVSDLPGRDGSKASDLTGRVSKTSNASAGTATVQPLVPELERAFGIVASLTGIDLSTDTGPLFRCLKLDEARQSTSGRPLETNQVYRLIANVAKEAGVEIVVRPHMFRRAFSMLYIWRYELGDLQHLSRFLHHNSLNHTMAYAQGSDVSIFMGDAQRELAKSIMERAITGKERVGGSLGVLLKRLANRLRSRTSVLRAEQVDDWLESRLAEGHFSLKAAPHGYCLILGERARRSKCSTDGRTPDYGNRTDEQCAACGNFLLTERSRQYWEARVSVHEHVAKTSRLTIVKRAAEQAIAAARRVLDSLDRS